MAATGYANVAQNLFVGGYGSTVQGVPGSLVMSSWIPPTFVGSAVATGATAAPGPTISYTSTGANTLVLAGYVVGVTSPLLSASSGITSVTDSTGGVNQWQWSRANSQFPPSAYSSDSNGYVAFVAWCVNAAAVTSVTVQDSTGLSDIWNVSLSEWAGITFPGYGVAGIAAPGGSGLATVTVPCSTPNDLIVAAMNPGTTVSTDPGFPFIRLPGTTLNNTHIVIGSQILTSIAPPGFVYVGSSGSTPFTGLTGALAVNTPPDLVPGDLLIFDVILSGAGTVTGWPAGFTQQLAITGVNSAANLRCVATKLADGTEGAALNVTVAGAGTGTAVLYGLRGAASATPANVATFTQSGYQTSAPAPALTINGTTDATVYGYGGCTSGNTGTVVISPAGLGTLLNSGAGLNVGHGCSNGIGWGTNVSAPGTITGISTAVDVLDYAMDFPLLPLGIGGQVTYQWTLTGSASNAVAAMSFGPVGVPVAVQPGGQAF